MPPYLFLHSLLNLFRRQLVQDIAWSKMFRNLLPNLSVLVCVVALVTLQKWSPAQQTPRSFTISLEKRFRSVDTAQHNLLSLHGHLLDLYRHDKNRTYNRLDRMDVVLNKTTILMTRLVDIMKMYESELQVLTRQSSKLESAVTQTGYHISWIIDILDLLVSKMKGISVFMENIIAALGLNKS